jgi:membrane protein implicated in regulation of membrane protease activity
VNAFFLLYALTVTLELVLSLVLALFLFMIVAPLGSGRRTQRSEPSRPPTPRQQARTLEGALGDAFVAVSEGRADVATLVHARHELQRFLDEPSAAASDD